LASLRAVRKLHKNAKLVDTPVLLFQAGNDKTVKPGGQKRFAKKSKNTKLVVITDSKHEIYNGNDIIRKEYYHKIFSFLDKQLE
jgi:lysophospholipase